uniref:Uncharacterized protein n=1 Tax=Cajanus cajan TaxID=3821 RepID=A0A151TPP4_CAJCA|nr:hypothetical protein KK1_022694 [Cajanus cajan]
MGLAFCNLIHDIEHSFDKVATVNEILITIIPKVDNTVYLKQMRPISHCNVSYKSFN